LVLGGEDVGLTLSIANGGYVMETGHIFRNGSVSKLRDHPDFRRAYLGL
jgi:branched-chain amino acid transport system ATP-binding protein